jgi:hypothetical protein
LLFEPVLQKLQLFRHDGERYVELEANPHGRLAVRDLDLEVAILDGWVRFWHQGKLLPLPAEREVEMVELRQSIDAETKRADAETRRADAETRRADAAERELAKLRAQMKKPQKKNAPRKDS